MRRTTLNSHTWSIAQRGSVTRFRSGRRADQMLEHPRFRAAYDFLLLRESAGEQTDGLGHWWTLYQDANQDERRRMIRELGGDKSSNPKRSRSRSRRKPRNNAPDA